MCELERGDDIRRGCVDREAGAQLVGGVLVLNWDCVAGGNWCQPRRVMACARRTTYRIRARVSLVLGAFPAAAGPC